MPNIILISEETSRNASWELRTTQTLKHSATTYYGIIRHHSEKGAQSQLLYELMEHVGYSDFLLMKDRYQTSFIMRKLILLF